VSNAVKTRQKQSFAITALYDAGSAMKDDEYKARIASRIDAFAKRQLKKSAPPTRKNAKPEEAVATECIDWMRAQGWSVTIFEAKATFDPRRGIYRQQAMKAGVADCLGNMQDGVSVVVEFKAPGKLTTFARHENVRQQRFLIEKIRSGAFACVVDSAKRLEMIHRKWLEIRNTDGILEAKNFLMSALPKPTRRYVSNR
jgi:hypothetical protein